jgi:hypothetical protein
MAAEKMQQGQPVVAAMIQTLAVVIYTDVFINTGMGVDSIALAEL